ncbi:CG13994 [Drosophila busckii]|uniref:E3 ubiquitin-protein ligase PPP1R11 n=1 Tax=Drosophila busckii TaxID=30019 RepID=A0A0M4EP22_DROBS|nr:type 1 phosphatases regulator ypi1 [Drosophila busckii]ALC38257.1 CG13994 [Drosophila busckii]
MAQQPLSNNINGTTTEIIDEGDSAEASQSTPTLVLRLEHPRDSRRVVFHEGVIDNEHMNKMKSKCCCIYKKPHAFGESSSDTDDECEHCFGHPEERKKNKKKKHSNATAQADEPCSSTEAQLEPKQADTDPIGFMPDELATKPTP